MDDLQTILQFAIPLSRIEFSRLWTNRISSPSQQLNASGGPGTVSQTVVLIAPHLAYYALNRIFAHAEREKEKRR